MKQLIIRFAVLFLFIGNTSVWAEERKLASGGSIVAPDGAEIVTDQATLDATLTEVAGEPDPEVEGIWFSQRGGVYYESHNEGYVSLDDWGDMDADALMETYVQGAAEQSKLMGINIEPLGWAIEPTLSEDKALAYYSLKFRFGEDDPLVNMVIYKFGRYGYEEITLVTGVNEVPNSEADRIAQEVASSFNFGENATYADFQDGDKVAAVGAAGLLAAAFGTKLGKAGLFALLLGFAKKGWFLIFIPIFAGWRFLKGRLFGG